MPYVLITRPSDKLLARAVRSAISEGWSPQGGVVVCPGQMYRGQICKFVWVQAMIRTHPPIDMIHPCRAAPQDGTAHG